MAHSGTYAAKDPSGVADYNWDFADDLEDGESITNHSVTATGCHVDATIVSGTFVVARISGGNPGDDALITYHITTSKGQEFEYTGLLPIREL